MRAKPAHGTEPPAPPRHTRFRPTPYSPIAPTAIHAATPPAWTLLGFRLGLAPATRPTPGSLLPSAETGTPAAGSARLLFRLSPPPLATPRSCRSPAQGECSATPPIVVTTSASTSGALPRFVQRDSERSLPLRLLKTSERAALRFGRPPRLFVRTRDVRPGLRVSG